MARTRFVRAHDLDSHREQKYRRNYVNLDRGAFDDWLLGLARERADVVFNARFAEHTRDGVILKYGNRTETLQTRLLIGADGALSSVRRVCFPGRPGPQTMLAIQAYCAHGRAPQAHEVLFASGLTDFYAWAIPKPGSMIVGCAFRDRNDATVAFEKILVWYRDLLGLGDELQPRSVRYLSRPRGRRDLFGGGGDVLLAGEAAGLVGPSSGEGISFALVSGAAAGRALGASDPLAEYRRTFDKLSRRVRVKGFKARVIYSPQTRSWALRLPWYP